VVSAVHSFSGGLDAFALNLKLTFIDTKTRSLYNSTCLRDDAGVSRGGVAQLVRARGSYPRRRRFESGLRYHYLYIWAVSSGGERFVDTEEVTSSNLVPPTISIPGFPNLSVESASFFRFRFFRTLLYPRCSPYPTHMA
jgi:hypothetical protein